MNPFSRIKSSSAHPGFQAVQSRISRTEGVSKDAAGAILASSARKASAKAKRKNPRLARVKSAKRYPRMA